MPILVADDFAENLLQELTAQDIYSIWFYGNQLQSNQPDISVTLEEPTPNKKSRGNRLCFFSDCQKSGVIPSQCAHWRTPGWPLLPLWGNSPPGNPPVFRTFLLKKWTLSLCLGDCHTSDIGHWFAMTGILTRSKKQRQSPLLFCMIITVSKVRKMHLKGGMLSCRRAPQGAMPSPGGSQGRCRAVATMKHPEKLKLSHLIHDGG